MTLFFSDAQDKFQKASSDRRHVPIWRTRCGQFSHGLPQSQPINICLVGRLVSLRLCRCWPFSASVAFYRWKNASEMCHLPIRRWFWWKIEIKTKENRPIKINSRQRKMHAWWVEFRKGHEAKKLQNETSVSECSIILDIVGEQLSRKGNAQGKWMRAPRTIQVVWTEK